jgi:hypothetical protein
LALLNRPDFMLYDMCLSGADWVLIEQRSCRALKMNEAAVGGSGGTQGKTPMTARTKQTAQSGHCVSQFVSAWADPARAGCGLARRLQR